MAATPSYGKMLNVGVFVGGYLSVTPSVLMPMFVVSPVLIYLSGVVETPVFYLSGRCGTSAVSSVILLGVSSSALVLFFRGGLGFILPVYSDPTLDSN